MKPIYIATFHQSKFGKLLGMTVPQIVDSAIQSACRQIGTEPAALDVGSIGAACNFSLNEQGLLAGLMADTPGMEGKPFLAIGRSDHRPALLLQVEPEELDDVALVIDDQDRLHRVVTAGFISQRTP